MDPNVIVNRVLRLARLDTSVFDEVRDDANELVPAMIVAAISFLLAGFGAFLFWEVADTSLEKSFLNALLFGTLFLIIMYVVAALAVYVVLAQVYRVTVDLQSLLRTMGYAALPMALSVLMFVPVIYPLFALAPLGLLLVFMIYAVQSASNAESNQVVIASFVGFSVFILVLGLIAVSSSYPNVPIGAGAFGLLLDFSA
ncbi:hypothetical protein AYO38_10970 [bacterium SCGC AG-212-C10]|nr:hypothetical protein AYO38_10970 [bacterium SCGC AG-212-C10]